MGLDLTLLLPLRGPEGMGGMGSTTLLCYDRLSFDRDSSIFGQLVDLTERGQSTKPTIKVHPIPPQMWVDTYEDGGIERTREDPYGDELTFVYAQQLRELKIQETASAKNKAIKAFVDALPDNFPIILLWR